MMDGTLDQEKGGGASAKADLLLLAGAVVIYCLMVFSKLTQFPPYFFCDEAIVGVDAANILSRGTDMNGNSWPLFFQGLGDYALSLTVYVQTLFDLVLGQSEWSIRVRSAVFSLMGALSFYLLLQRVFGLSRAWLAVFICAVSPVWLVHSRTGFEYITAGAFYLMFICFYFLGHKEHPKWWYAASIAAALCFYSYTPARGWIMSALVVLGMLNLGSHIKQFKSTAIAGVILFVIMIPYLVLHWTHPEITMKRLAALGAPSLTALITNSDHAKVTANFLQILSPDFWFTWERTQHEGPMVRHVIPLMAPFPTWLLPFWGLGLLSLLIKIRSRFHRGLLGLLIISPFPAVFIDVNNARCFNVGCLYLVLIGLGLAGTLDWLARIRPLRGLFIAPVRRALSVALFIGASTYALWLNRYMFGDALQNYDDYGFYGVQYGAPQLFEWVKKDPYPGEKFHMASHLFNASHVYLSFFLHDESWLQRFEIIDFENLCKSVNPIADNALVIARSSALQELKASGCPLVWDTLNEFKDPRGQPNFAAIRMRRAPEYAEWREKMFRQRTELISTDRTINGKMVHIAYPLIDMGDPGSLFDGDPNSIVRTQQINPARFQLSFAETKLTGILVILNNTTEADVELHGRRGTKNVSLAPRKHFSARNGDSPQIHFDLSSIAEPIDWVEVRVNLTDQGEYGTVHLAEISLEGL